MRGLIYVLGLTIGAVCGFAPSTMIAMLGIAILSYLYEINDKLGGGDEE